MCVIIGTLRRQSITLIKNIRHTKFSDVCIKTTSWLNDVRAFDSAEENGVLVIKLIQLLVKPTVLLRSCRKYKQVMHTTTIFSDAMILRIPQQTNDH